MKRYLLIIPLTLITWVVIYGQQKSGKTQHNTNAAQNVAKSSTPKGPSSVIVINEEATQPQTNTAADHSQNYFRRLFSPENLPNILLFVVGVVGTCLALRTLKNIEQQTALMEQQIIVPHRARLALGEFQKPVGNEIRFAIENYGQLAGRIIHIDATIIILNTESGEMSFHKSEKFDTTVAPGKEGSIALSFRVPTDVDIFSKNVQMFVNGTIDYEIGIKGTDTLAFSRLHLGGSERWEAGTPAIELVFTKSEAADNQGEKSDE